MATKPPAKPAKSAKDTPAPAPAVATPAADAPAAPAADTPAAEAPAADAPAADAPAAPATETVATPTKITDDELEKAKAAMREAALARLEKNLEAKALKLAARTKAKEEKEAKRGENAKDKPASSRKALNWREAKQIEHPVHAAFTTTAVPPPQKQIVYVNPAEPVEMKVKIVGLNYLESYVAAGKTIKGPGIALDIEFKAQVKVGTATADASHHLVQKFDPGDALPWVLLGNRLRGEGSLESAYTLEDAIKFAPPPPPEKPKKEPKTKATVAAGTATTGAEPAAAAAPESSDGAATPAESADSAAPAAA